ncbi:MAG: exonuclease SbcCD subunit D [Chloroflexota bacterium]
MTTSQPVKILHFADAHIDMANYGRHDPNTALPVRVGDFLHALDQIVDAAIEEKVDFVLFAGDAYKDRNPQPTFQRAWGKRMMRLAEAKIPTLLLIGNHDVSPSSGRAHTLQEFTTLDVPYMHVADSIKLWTPEELGIPLQVISLPWVSRSMLMNREDMQGKNLNDILSEMADRVSEFISQLIERADKDIPLILTAHTSIEGAKYGSERQVMLGRELTLSPRLVRNKTLDYVALGHIHKHQSLNDGDAHPPIIYPGSIERVDFGEIREKKGFILADVTNGDTNWQFIRLDTRRFIDKKVETREADSFMADILNQLPLEDEVENAICRVSLSYPRDWEPMLDEKAILDRFKKALDIKIVKNYTVEDRTRLGDTVEFKSLTPIELLDKYWGTKGLHEANAAEMKALAQDILGE